MIFMYFVQPWALPTLHLSPISSGGKVLARAHSCATASLNLCLVCSAAEVLGPEVQSIPLALIMFQTSLPQLAIPLDTR